MFIFTHIYRSYAYRAGVTTAISAPRHFGLIGGLGVAFSTGAAHKLEPGAIMQRVTALHITVSLNSPISVSTQIGTLRRLLFGHGTGEVAEHFKQVAEVSILVIASSSCHSHSLGCTHARCRSS